MHFEILVEDISGKVALEKLMPNLISSEHTYIIKSYKGIGRLPKNIHQSSDPAKRVLLEQLPKLLQGYGKTFAGYPTEYAAAVIVVCDLDRKCLKSFRQQLIALLSTCNPAPETRFCLAIEEGEAWLLGDSIAVKQAFPHVKMDVLNCYQQDSICGTWEVLADALYKGGAKALTMKGWQEIGAEKSRWAERIAPRIDVVRNASPSFQYFRKKLLELCNR